MCTGTCIHQICIHKKHVEGIVDSGASKHITGTRSEFREYSPSMHKHPETIQIADGTFQPIRGTGSIHCTPSITFSSVLHVPSFPVNLLSVSSAIDDLNCRAIFDQDICVFQEKGTGRTLGTGKRRNGLWYLDEKVTELAAALIRRHEEEIMLQHCRLGHVFWGNE